MGHRRSLPSRALCAWNTHRFKNDRRDFQTPQTLDAHKRSANGLGLLFAARPDGWLRVRLKTGAWVGGAYASGSFASGYPERRDLFIVQAAELDPQTGLFETDANGSVRLRDEQILVDGENIDYLEFTDG